MKIFGLRQQMCEMKRRLMEKHAGVHDVLIRLLLVNEVSAYQVPPVGVVRRYRGALTQQPITRSRSWFILLL